MDKRTKLILSAVGLAAIIVPALLLILLAGKDKSQPPTQSTSRPLDTKNIEEAVRKVPTPATVLPSPTPATESAAPKESSPSPTQ